MNARSTATADNPAADDEKPHPDDRRRQLIRLAMFLVLIVGLFAAALMLDLAAPLKAARDWIEALGPWAPAGFILIYVVCTILMVPGSPLTAAAGGLFGSVWGAIYVSIAATIGAAICFLIARYLARDAVREWLKDKPTFQKLDRMTEEHGFWIVAITRLVPLFPFNLLNYGFGLTSVRFWTYVFWSWLCMLPGTILYVVGADAIVKGIEQGRVPWALVGVAAAMIVLVTGLTWLARRKIAAAESASGATPPNGAPRS